METLLHELIERLEKETGEMEAQIESYKERAEDMMPLFLAGKFQAHQSLIGELKHILNHAKTGINR
jgi:hypothetical protein